MERLSGVTFFLCLAVSNGYAAEKPLPLEQFKITESCYHNWKNINKDGAQLAAYFNGIWEGVGMSETEECVKQPSNIFNDLRNRPDEMLHMKLNTLLYDSASWYIPLCIKDAHDDTLDTIFAEKYRQTNNRPEAWKLFADYFKNNVVNKAIGSYCKEMIEKNAGIIASSRKGSFEPTRTLLWDGNYMFEKPVYVEEVRSALEIVERK